MIVQNGLTDAAVMESQLTAADEITFDGAIRWWSTSMHPTEQISSWKSHSSLSDPIPSLKEVGLTISKYLNCNEL